MTTKIIPFTEYQSGAKIKYFAAGSPDEKKYPSPEDDPACKYNGKYVVSDCFCKYHDFYTKNKDKYKLSEDQLLRYNDYCWNKVTNFGRDLQCQAQRPDSLSINCYCKYPAAYKNSFFGLTKQQIDNLDSRCAILAQQGRNDLRPPTLKQKIIKKGEEGARWLSQKGIMFAEGFLQPQSLAFMFGMKVAENLLPKLADLFGRAVIKLLEEMLEIIVPALQTIAEFASEALLAIIPEFATEAIMAVAAAGAAAAAETFAFLGTLVEIESVSLAIPGLGEVVSGALMVYTAILFEGMLLDLFTESELYGYDKMINGEFLLKISKRYDDVFLQVILQNINLPEGQNWPVEYMADHVIFAEKPDKETKIKQQSMQIYFVFEYLKFLTYNSRGEFIYPLDVSSLTKEEYLRAIDQIPIKDGLSRTLDGLSYLYSNSNTTAVIFLKKNWLIILIIVLVIIIFLLFIK